MSETVTVVAAWSSTLLHELNEILTASSNPIFGVSLKLLSLLLTHELFPTAITVNDEQPRNDIILRGRKEIILFWDMEAIAIMIGILSGTANVKGHCYSYITLTLHWIVT